MVKATKKTKRIKVEYKVYLLYDEDTHGGGVCTGDENSDWPNYEDEHNTFTPKGLRLKTPDWSETIEVDFDPSGFDHLYIVVVRYSSGNTFGNTFGHWHIEGAYQTFEKAEKVETAIKKGTGKYKEGEGHYHPWEGYFESLEGASVERMDIWK